MVKLFYINSLFKFLDQFVVVLGLMVLAGMIGHFGFNLDVEYSHSIFQFVIVIAGLYTLQEIFRFFRYNYKWNYLKERWYESFLFLAIVLMTCFLLSKKFDSDLQRYNWWIGSYSLIILLGLFSSMSGRFESQVRKSRFQLRPTQVFLLSFALPILCGAGLLMLPKASVIEMKFVDALFMATSSMCVTGLAVFDLEKLTLFGQLVMLGLIQLGGLGIMTLTIAFSGIIAGGLSIKDRLTLSSMFSGERLSEVKNLLAKIFVFTIVIELIGAILIFIFNNNPVFKHDAWTKAYYAIFHAISAFCNAGFSPYKANLFENGINSNYPFISTIMILIVLGGLGFPTLSNLYYYFKSRILKYRQPVLLRISSKIILLMTIQLLVFGTLLIFFFESEKSFSSLNGFDRFFNSAFLSVTSRTAGFSMWPTESLSVVAMFIMIFLMWVGGAPMSTAGGIKVTTFFVGLLNIKGSLQGSERAEFMGRQISQRSVSKAFAVVCLSLSFIAIASLALMFFEPTVAPLDLIFEVVSAISTVGLSRNLTPMLSDISKLILVFMMFIGRVGLIAFVMAFYKPPASLRYKYLEEEIVIT